MKKFTEDDLRDIAIQIVDELVENNLIKDCIDTDDETEFEVQDIILEKLKINLDI
jgi:hypothetical protein